MTTADSTVFSPESPRRWQDLWWVLALAFVPTLVKLLCYPTYPGSDDAFIHLTVIRNVTHGLGWGINPGEPVNVSSSPLYTALVSLFNLAGLDALVVGIVLSSLAGAVAVVATHRLLVALGVRREFCLAGAVFAAFNIHLWRWNGVVMETTLGACLLTLAYWSYHRADDGPGRPPTWRLLLTGALAGLAMLTRFELGLAVGCFGLRELVVYRPQPARWLRTWALLTVSFLVTIAPWFLFCKAYFHLVLPTTFYAKTSSGLLWWNPMVGSELLKVSLSGDLVPLLGVGLLAVAVFFRRRTATDHAGQPSLFLKQLDVYLFPLLLALFYYLKTPNLQSAARYYLPGVQLLAVVLACALDALSAGLPERALRRGVLALVAVHALLALGFNQFRVAPTLSRFKDNYWHAAQEASAFLKTRATPDRRLNVLVEVDIGMLSFYAGDACYFIDGGALATPSLRDLTVPQQVAQTSPDVVAEMLGDKAGGLTAEIPALVPLWSKEFLSHSVTAPRGHFVTTIYENRR